MNIQLVCINNGSTGTGISHPAPELEEGKEYIVLKTDRDGDVTQIEGVDMPTSRSVWRKERFMDAEKYYKQHSQQYEIY